MEEQVATGRDQTEIPVGPELRALLKREGVTLGKLADYLGVSQPRVSEYLKGGFPAEHCLSLEIATGGKLKAWKFTTDRKLIRILKLYGERTKPGWRFAR